MSEGESAQVEPEAPAAAMRRRRRWPWVLLVLMIALGFGLRALLPFAVERGAAWGSRYYLGLPARIENVDFALLDGRVVLEGVTVAAAADDVAPNDAALDPPPIDVATALVHVERISTRLDWKDLLDSTVHLTELAVDAPTVQLEPEPDGKIDPLRHARPAAPPSPDEPPDPDAPPPWKILVDAFTLKAPNVRAIDPKGGEDLLEFSLEDFGLTEIVSQGKDFSLGGVKIGGPVLRIRRDLLIAAESGPDPLPVDPAAAPAASEEAAAAATQEAVVAADGEAAAVATPTAVPPAPAAAPAQPAAEPGYRIANVDIERANFTWITENGPLEVTLALHASDISADQGKRFPLDLQLQIGTGKMRIAGDVGIVPPSYTGKIEWDGLPIPRILLVSVPQFAGWLTAAKSSGDLQIDADPTGAKGPAAMRVAGRLTFDALAVSDPEGNEVTLGWQQLEVVMRDVYAPIPQEGKPLGTTKAVLDSVALTEPKIRYTRPSPQLDALLGIDLSGTGANQKKGAAAEPITEKEVTVGPADVEPAKAAAPIEVEIASLTLTNGSIEALDKTVTPAARTKIGDLALEATDVRFPATAAKKIRFGATLPKTAKLEVRGDLAPNNVGDFTLSLKRLDLATFNPYAGAAAGVTVEKGTASADTKLKMRGAKMNIDTKLVLNEFGVSMRDPETFEKSFGVPLDLALALLRDPNGNIALTIPVALDEKGSKVDTGAVIASAIKAALIGAITAPLKLLGSIFDRGDDDGAGGFAIEPLTSVAGSPELEGDPQASLDGLAKMLKERPEIGLALRGRVGPEDHPIVAEQILVEQWSAGKGLPELEDASFFARRRIGRALERRAKGEPAGLEPEDQALLERYIAAIAIPDARLDALAKARAERVRALLVEKGIPAARVAVGKPEAESEPGVVLSFKAG